MWPESSHRTSIDAQTLRELARCNKTWMAVIAIFVGLHALHTMRHYEGCSAHAIKIKRLPSSPRLGSSEIEYSLVPSKVSVFFLHRFHLNLAVFLDYPDNGLQKWSRCVSVSEDGILAGVIVPMSAIHCETECRKYGRESYNDSFYWPWIPEYQSPSFDEDYNGYVMHRRSEILINWDRPGPKHVATKNQRE